MDAGTPHSVAQLPERTLPVSLEEAPHVLALPAKTMIASAYNEKPTMPTIEETVHKLKTRYFI